MFSVNEQTTKANPTVYGMHEAAICRYHYTVRHIRETHVPQYVINHPCFPAVQVDVWRTHFFRESHPDGLAVNCHIATLK